MLMQARALHQRSICPGCGNKKADAWHPDNEGWFEAKQVFECHACTTHRRASAGEDSKNVEPVVYPIVTFERDYKTRPLPESEEVL